MKKILLLTVALLNVFLLSAQGIYQLWGMTPAGGENNLGIIYNTNANGNNFRLKHSFNFTNSGSQPGHSGLAEYNNKFYGMTGTGGENNAGIIFEWDPSTNSMIKKFAFGTADGMYPDGSLTLHEGKFYGMTKAGGVYDGGVIFEWDPLTNIYTKKIDLVDSGGTHPSGDLVYSNGHFYGVTFDGGRFNYGVLFQWDPLTNLYNKIIDFDGVNGGYGNYGYTAGNLIGMGNKIYGLTNGANYGAIFELDALTNKYRRVFEFDAYTSGEIPGGNLAIRAGKLYGFNLYNEINDDGALVEKKGIFEWDPSTGEFTRKITFNDIGGQIGYLTVSGDKFYGLTYDGIGSPNNKGTIFEWVPASNVATKKFDFDGSNGAYPQAPLTLKNGLLFGMTSAGGAYGWQRIQGDIIQEGYGVIFQWDPVSDTYTKKIDFEGKNGTTYPVAGLTFYKGKLYGRTGYGGDSYPSSFGQIFEFDPELDLYSKKTVFGGGYDNAPCGNLTLYNNKFYAMTTGGGDRGYGGAVSEWDPVNNNYMSNLFFGWPSKGGYFPHGSVTAKDGILYGMTTSGGQDEEGFQTNDGVLFSWKLDSINPTNPANYNPLFSFSNPSGSNPYGSLTEKDGKLYGMTIAGGDYNKGVIFEYNPPPFYDYAKKIDFDSANGAYPRGDLTLVNGKFYGMTSAGGAHNAGVIFEWDPTTNIYQKKYDFDGINSSSPAGNLTYSGGKFYGVCFYGKPGYGGLIFEWDPATNIFTDKLDFNGANGSLLGPLPPSGSHDLTLAPASVSNGLPGTCKTFPSVTIDNTNNNQWISITDEENNAIAEIKANGNNLGVVTTSMFINNTAVREDGTKRLYLDRNISITPEMQPTTPVDIRLYIKGSEYEILKNAVNSNGQASGIDSNNDISIYKVSGGCVPAVSTLTNPLATIAGTWEADYVFSASIPSFSSFYFAGKAVCTAPVITQVCANPSTLWPPNHHMKNVTVNYKVKGDCQPVSTWLTVTSDEPVVGTGRGDRDPDWIIEDDHHLQLRAERAGHGNGRAYTITINAKDAAGNTSTQKTKVLVPHHWSSHHGNDWKDEHGYVDANGDYVDQELNCRIIPNPTNDYFNVQIESASDETIQLSLLDISGRLITKWNTVKDKTIRFGEQLRPGIYIVKIQQGEQLQMLKIIKQLP